MFKVLGLLVTFNIISVYGLKCFTCSTSENDIDTRCITNPGAVEENGVTNCNKLFCTIVRVEYVDPKGKVQSISRDCVDKPIYSNHVQEDTTFRAYYTSCRTDLCNGGTGKDISSGNHLLEDNGLDAVLYVVGIRDYNGAASIYSSIALIIMCLYLVIF
ncbi:hypothetical protein FQA39_LY01703 [Lamprigera yunnana]|nr:hypothetical protein FQA39_LY01703 [Lamprigera yunnana]